MVVSTEKKNSAKEKIATITNWHSIDWNRAERQVRTLQKRITNAYEQEAYRKVKRLQYVLHNSPPCGTVSLLCKSTGCKAGNEL